MKVQSFAVGPFQENTYLVIDETARVAVLIDPGAEPERLAKAVHSAGITLQAIWLTHAHVDHVGAIAALVREFGAPVAMHPLDRPLYEDAVNHGLLFGLTIEQPPPADVSLDEGDQVRVGSLAFQVMHVPGHAPGHVVFHGQGVAFVGDCLFAGSIGRTDLPLSDGAKLAASLERICTLPDDTTVYPGHGPPTTIGEERASNPFLNGTMRIAQRR